MKYLVKLCDRFGLLQSELDYHFLRASMVLIFLFFGYQKWWEYEAQALILYISNGPLIFWILFSASGEPPGSWGFRSGYSARSCSGDSGIRKPELLAPSVDVLHSYPQQQSFRSFRMAGLRPPVDFQQ